MRGECSFCRVDPILVHRDVGGGEPGVVEALAEDIAFSRGEATTELLGLGLELVALLGPGSLCALSGLGKRLRSRLALGSGRLIRAVAPLLALLLDLVLARDCCSAGIDLLERVGVLAFLSRGALFEDSVSV